MPEPRILVIAGHDPSGSAGQLADARAITALGGFAMTVITAVTSQNTHEVLGVAPVDCAVLDSQLRAVLADVPLDGVKVGLVPTPEHVAVIRRCLATVDVPVVWDPVLASTSGTELVAPGTNEALREALDEVTLGTPNASEAHSLRVDPGLEGAWLVTGGDVDGETVVDRLWLNGVETVFRHPRVAGGPFRGTGCALSSTLAVQLANGASLADAVASSIHIIEGRLRRARHTGAGPKVL